MKPLKNCKAGDIIEAKDGSKALVLARLGPLIFRSDWYQYDVAHYRPVTVHEAEQSGWRILHKSGKYPMTQSEVEDLLNVKIIKK